MITCVSTQADASVHTIQTSKCVHNYVRFQSATPSCATVHGPHMSKPTRRKIKVVWLGHVYHVEGLCRSSRCVALGTCTSSQVWTSNGQWSMPARHKASPFWAQAVKRKLDYVHWLCMRFIAHLAERVGNFKECSPVMVAFRFLQPWPQTFVSTKTLDLIVPGVRPPSQGSVSDRYIPSKNYSHPAIFR